MPSRRRTGSQLRFEFFGVVTLSNVLDWAVTLLVSALLILTTLQIGGVRAETQLIGIWLSGLILIVHGLWQWVDAGKNKLQINRWVLLFAPFVCYVLLSWLLLSPTPWVAREDALICLQAYIILWVTVNGLKLRNQHWFILIVLSLLCFVSALMAFNQYFRAPEWLPHLYSPITGDIYKLRNDPIFEGRASGFFAAPSSMAGFLLLALFPAMVAAMSKHLSPILKVFSGYFALMIIAAMIMTLSREGLVCMFVGLLMIPWFVGYKRPKAMKYSICFFLLSLLITIVLLFFSKRFSGTWSSWESIASEQHRLNLWSGAGNIFMQHPILGSGLGSFRSLFDQFRLEGYASDPLHVHNQFLEMASDLGVIGFMLFTGVVVWFFLCAVRSWVAMPDTQALDDIGKDRRRKRIFPAQKLFLSSAILSLFFFGVHMVFESHLHVPALLFWAAFFLGTAIKSMPSNSITFKLPKPYVYPVGLIAIGVGLPLFTSSGYVAEAYATEGKWMGDAFSKRFNELRFDPEFHARRQEVLEAALTKNESHGEAHANLAFALVDQSYVEPGNRIALGKQAEAHARMALELFPQSPLYHISLAEALFLQEEWQTSGDAYLRAIEIAPNSSTAWYYYANWLNGEPGKREEALEAIERSIELDPDNKAARELRLKILIP